MSSLRPCLRADLSFRRRATRTALVDATGTPVFELEGIEVEIVSVMDGATALDELVATARTIGLSDEAAVPSLLARLEAAGCLEEPGPADAPGTGMVVANDELMRKAIILASRGLDGPARNVLAELESRAPGSPEVADLLAVLDAEAVMAVDDVAAAEVEGRRRDAEAKVIEAPPPTYAFAPKKAPAKIGRVGRKRLRKLQKFAILVAILSVIPIRAGVHGPAKLQPERVQVLRSGVHGVIEKILVSDGAAVAAGQPLMMFEQGPTQTQIGALEAMLASLRAQHRELERGGDPSALVEARSATSAAAALVSRQSAECSQVEQLVHSGVLPAAALDTCRQSLASTRTRSSVAHAQLVGANATADPAALAASRARLQAAEGQLAEMRGSLATLTVRSPFAGRVVAPNLAARRGALVEVGEELGRVVGGRGAIARILLEPSDVAVVRVGADVILRTRALGDRTLTGRVVHIAETLETQADGSPKLVVEARVPKGVPMGVVDLPAAAEIKAGWTVLTVVVSRRLRSWISLEVVPFFS